MKDLSPNTWVMAFSPISAIPTRTNMMPSAHGYQSMACSAMIEAETQVYKGIDLLAALPDGPERQQFEVGLQMALGLVLIATKGYTTTVGEMYSRARQLFDQLGRPLQLSMILSGHSVYHCIRGELALASH